MTHFDKLIELATEAKKLHEESKLEMCWKTLELLAQYQVLADNQVYNELGQP